MQLALRNRIAVLPRSSQTAWLHPLCTSGHRRLFWSFCIAEGMQLSTAKSQTAKGRIRPLYAAFLDRLDKDDDGGNFTTADERHEALRIAKTYFDKEAPRPGKHGVA